MDNLDLNAVDIVSFVPLETSLPTPSINSNQIEQEFVLAEANSDFFQLPGIRCIGGILKYICIYCFYIAQRLIEEVHAIELLLITMSSPYSLMCQMFFLTMCDLALLSYNQNPQNAAKTTPVDGDRESHQHIKMINGLSTLLLYSVFSYFVSKLREIGAIRTTTRTHRPMRDLFRWTLRIIIEWIKVIALVICLKEQGLRHTGEDADSKSSKLNAEQKLLAKVQKRIERNKVLRGKRKEKDVQNKLLKEKAIAYRYERKLEKLSNQNKIIAIPTTAPTEYVKDVADTEESIEDKRKRKKRKSNKIIQNDIEKLTQINTGYTVLGGEHFEKKSKIERVLPKWLTNPTVISVDLQNLDTKVSSHKQLDKRLRKKLKANGFNYLFPVQAQVIPYILKSNAHASALFPRDVCVSAPTGSGKTLAFALPVIQLLQKYTIRQVRALVILPTQDLALQVYHCFRDYSDATRLVVALAVGKSNMEQEQRMLVNHTEAFGYQSRADILVCTAGRLVDHIKYTKGFNLKYLDFLIVDEADRVLDSVQSDWLIHLEQHIYTNNHPSKILNINTLMEKRPPQKLLFSATLSQDPEKLEKMSLFQPKLFTSILEKSDADNDEEVNDKNVFVGKYTTPRELSEKYILSGISVKPLVLYKFILTEDLTKTIIFANSMENVHRLTVLLKLLFKGKKNIDEISSNLTPDARKLLIGKFSEGKVDILICTDALTRGIDLPGVKCVISYSAPKYIETYIHRVGRTARAGEKGLAVTMTDAKQLFRLRKTLENVGKRSPEEIEISQEDLEPLEEQYKNALNQLKSTVTEEDATSLIKVKKSKQIPSYKRFTGKRNGYNVNRFTNIQLKMND